MRWLWSMLSLWAGNVATVVPVVPVVQPILARAAPADRDVFVGYEPLKLSGGPGLGVFRRNLEREPDPAP